MNKPIFDLRRIDIVCDELQEEVQSLELFHSFNYTPIELVVINNLKIAKENYAWTDFPVEGAMHWMNLFESMLSFGEEILSYDNSVEIKKKFRSATKKIDEMIVRKLSSMDIEHRELEGDIQGITEGLAIGRVFMENGHPFWEMCFDVLKKGGWPCGWIGEYPEGKMVVYAPKDEK